MQTPGSQEITALLVTWRQGDEQALARLLPIVYQELRKIADAYLHNERADHTLQPTALIHEVYLRLVDQSLPQWQNRAHFYGVAAQLMRQILVEHARGRAALKRGGGKQKFSLDESLVFSEEKAAELVALDDALLALAKLDKRKVRIIEMRYFGGLSLEETAEALGLSITTISDEQRLARAWLRREMEN